MSTSSDPIKMTDRQADVLYQVGRSWLRPMDMGARDSSGHSAILGALVSKGLVERQYRGGGVAYARGSYVYRITDEGVAALASLGIEVD